MELVELLMRFHRVPVDFRCATRTISREQADTVVHLNTEITGDKSDDK